MRPSRRAFACALLAAPFSLRAQPGELRIGLAFDDTAMAFRRADGTPDGLAVAFGQFLAQGMGLRPVLRELAFGGRIDALAAGEVDVLTGVPPMNMDALRRVMFGRPFATAEWVMVLPSTSRIVALAELRDHPVGVLLGGEALFLQRQLAGTRPAFETFPRWQDMGEALLAGRLAAAALASHVAERLLALRPQLRRGFPLGAGLYAPAVAYGEHRLLHRLDSLVALGFHEGIIPTLHRHFLGTAAPSSEAWR